MEGKKLGTGLASSGTNSSVCQCALAYCSAQSFAETKDWLS